MFTAHKMFYLFANFAENTKKIKSEFPKRVEHYDFSHECLLKDVSDERAPVRERTVRTKQCPFMNGFAKQLSKRLSFSIHSISSVRLLTGKDTENNAISRQNLNVNPSDLTFTKGVLAGRSQKISGPP